MDAALSRRSGDSKEAWRSLEGIHNPPPELGIDVARLRVLVAEKTADLERSLKALRDLILILRVARHPPRETGAARFELGILLLKSGKVSEARPEFEEALKLGANEEACHYFLGLIEFRRGACTPARRHFEDLDEDAPTSFRAEAELDRAKCLQEEGLPFAARSYFVARERAEENLEHLAAKDVEAPAEKALNSAVAYAAKAALKPYETYAWSAWTALLIGYDSNLPLIPSSAPSSTETSGKSSSEATLQAVYLLASPQDQRWIWSGGYEGGFNYNLNSAARSYQFWSNTVAGQLERANEGPWHFFGRTSASFVLQDYVDPSSGNTSLTPFFLSGLIAPVAQRLFDPVWDAAFELDVRPEKFFTDPPSGDSRRSGMDFAARATLSRAGPARLWLNPTAALAAGLMTFSGAEFQSRYLYLELADRLGTYRHWTGSGSAGFGLTSYPYRLSGGRWDETLDLKASIEERFRPNWAALGNLDAILNLSNISDQYQYSRFAFFFGVKYIYL